LTSIIYLFTPQHRIILQTYDLNEIGIQAKIIPGGFTSYLQILDVCINAPYKSNYKNLCNNWFGDENHQQFTTTGNRRKPGYNLIAQWVSESLN
jgi:hypothetical protein